MHELVTLCGAKGNSAVDAGDDGAAYAEGNCAGDDGDGLANVRGGGAAVGQTPWSAMAWRPKPRHMRRCWMLPRSMSIAPAEDK